MLHLPTQDSSREDNFGQGLFGLAFTLDKAESVLVDAYKEANDQWEAIADKSSDFSGFLRRYCTREWPELVVAHTGDCRAVMREGKKTTVLTKDTDLRIQKRRLGFELQGGFIKGGRVMGVLAPSRGFGDLDVKRSAPSPEIIISEPDIIRITLPDRMPKQKGHTFCVLATDGVWDAMKSEKAMDIVSKVSCVFFLHSILYMLPRSISIGFVRFLQSLRINILIFILTLL